MAANHAAYQALDGPALVHKMRTKKIVDGVNVVPADAVRKAGGMFAAIGRL